MKRLLKKQSNEETLYKFRSPITVNFGDEFSWKADTDDLKNVPEYEDLIKEAIDSEMQEMGVKGLAEYLNKDYNEEIYNYIDSIITTVQNCEAITVVKTIEDLLPNQLANLKEYIEGQYSDGFGESFEQQTLDEYKENSEDEAFDEETQEYYTEENEYTVTISASLWNNKNWDLTLI